MAPSRSSLTKESSLAQSLAQSLAARYKPAGVSKPIARAKAAKPVARATTTRPATRAYAKKVKEVKSEEPEEESPIRVVSEVVPTVIARPTLQPSALPAPIAPANTETELENLMTIGREQVEKELKDRIKEEREKKLLLEKQKTAFRKYQSYLAGLKGLEEDLGVLKADNRMDEDTVMELAEDFRENTMKWARLFEKYAEELGITVFDIRKLGEAW